MSACDGVVTKGREGYQDGQTIAQSAPMVTKIPKLHAIFFMASSYNPACLRRFACWRYNVTGSVSNRE
ncbi:Uncharacterised protein [Vibrio cholerae]|nr:Uncharacterised protein [Vibrio cholerae]